MSLQSERHLKVTDIPLKVQYKSGDEFETSGIGGIYPKGIMIGKVIEFVEKKNPKESEAILQPFVDFDRLERVAVIIKSNKEM